MCVCDQISTTKSIFSNRVNNLYFVLNYTRVKIEKCSIATVNFTLKLFQGWAVHMYAYSCVCV